MRVLITGASGFVGFSLGQALLEAGHAVVGLTRDPKRELPARVERKLGSIGDPQSVAEAARGAEVIVHCAGITSLSAPERVLRWVHVAGTENVLRAARHSGVRRVVHMSCADISLCREDRMHWSETRVLPSQPVGSFARSKLMAEEIALAASDETLEVVALRPSLLWGPGQVAGLCELKREIDAGGVQLYDQGRNILASTHISHLTQATERALSAAHAPARAYYITDGEFLEAKELYTRLLTACTLPIRFRQAGLTVSLLMARTQAKLGLSSTTHEAEILRRGKSALFDLSNASKDLGYAPSLPMEQGLTEMSAWLQKEGGIQALLSRERPAPTAADVDDQVRLAGGD